MRHPHRIGTLLGSVVTPEESLLDGMAPLRVRIREEQRHPTLSLRRVSFGDLLTQVTVGHVLTNIGTVRRMMPR
jgi:hypothetical protein